MNSTTVLQALERLAGEQGTTRDIDINDLAAILDIKTTALVALLTELEHRDEITINISAVSGSENYAGTVRLMATPPDELTGNG